MNSFTPQQCEPRPSITTPHLLEIGDVPPAHPLQPTSLPTTSDAPQFDLPATAQCPASAALSSIRVVGDHDSDIGPIVLVNGLLQTADSWRSAVDILKPFAQVISYNLRFQGPRSTAAELPEGDNCHVGDLVALLDFLEIERTTLIGQSFGARVALDFALRH